MCAQAGVLPGDINKFSETLVKTGRSVIITSTVNRRRQELGLPELKDVNAEELQIIIE